MILTKSQSKCLLTIDNLLSNRDYIKAIDIVKKLNVTRSSCHSMIEILSDLGLIKKDKNQITLTQSGDMTAKLYKTYFDEIYNLLSKKINGNIDECVFVLMETLSQEQLSKLCTTMN